MAAFEALVTPVAEAGLSAPVLAAAGRLGVVGGRAGIGARAVGGEAAGGVRAGAALA